MSRRALAVLPLLAGLGLATPASAAPVPPPCPPMAPVYFTADATATYVHVRDPRQYCGYVTIALPLTVPPTATASSSASGASVAFPCDPQPLVQSDSTGTYVVVRDPTQPCAYIRIRVPVDIQK